jgi:hypothetical protein
MVDPVKRVPVHRRMRTDRDARRGCIEEAGNLDIRSRRFVSNAPEPVDTKSMARDKIEASSRDSFPASDPPSWTPIVRLGRPGLVDG